MASPSSPRGRGRGEGEGEGEVNEASEEGAEVNGGRIQASDGGSARSRLQARPRPKYGPNILGEGELGANHPLQGFIRGGIGVCTYIYID